ncbi:MAG TPA: hypothetical protein PKZ12_05640 [Smithellaceae bacterium]|nr:hypothetical protein [Smithellaceae bacterium]
MGKKVNPELLKYDKRIISRSLLSGEISEKELHSFFKKLPDVADNAEEISIEPAHK